MPYDEDLARRIRELLDGAPDVVEKKMFGGLAFLVAGRMAVGAVREGLMTRCDPDDTAALLAQPYAHPFEMRGKALQGWLLVDSDGAASEEGLRSWVWPAVGYARSLGPKA